MPQCANFSILRVDEGGRCGKDVKPVKIIFTIIIILVNIYCASTITCMFYHVELVLNITSKINTLL